MRRESIQVDVGGPGSATATLRQAFTALVLVLLAEVVVVVGYLGSLKLARLPAPTLSDIVLLLTAATGAAVGVLALLARRFGLSWRQLGFVRPGWRLLHLLWQAPAALLVSGLTAAGVLTLTTGAPRRSSATDTLEGLESAPLAVLCLALLLVVVVAPVWEETLFRGFFFGGFLRRLGPAGAIVGSGALFAAFHVLPILWAYLVPLGLCLGWIRWFHRNVWASVLVHAFNNALVMGALLAAR